MKISMKKLNMLSLRLAIYVFLSYGFFYSAYKSWTPEIFGGNDFYQYYLMYLNPIDNNAIAPFAYRIFGPLITNIIYNIGFEYTAIIQYTNPVILKEVFFSVIFSNYIALLLTALIVSMVTDLLNENKSPLVSLFSGSAVFFLFATMPYNLSGIQESWSMFFYALIYLCYLKKSKLILSLIFISIFQREIIPVVFLIFIVLEIIYRKSISLYQAGVLIASVLSFTFYIILRIYLVPIEGFEDQLSFTTMIENLLSFEISFRFIISSVFAQNLYLSYLGILIIKYLFFKDYSGFFAFFQISLILFFLLLLGIGTGIGDNVGRIMSQTSVFYIPLLFINLNQLLKKTSFS